MSSKRTRQVDTPECAPSEHVVRVAGAESYEFAAQLFRAIADTGRLRLLHYLCEGESCVSELAASLGDPVPAVSQRLRLLRQDGLVARRRDGRHIYYRLQDDHVRQLIDNALAHARELEVADEP